MAQEWIKSESVPQNRIEEVVLRTVAEALDLEPEEVSLDAKLQDELGAESLDYLDVAFRLEREFQITLPRANLLQRAGEHFGEATLVADGRVTDFGLRLLRSGLPEIEETRLQPGLKAMDVPRLFTVQTFVRLVDRLLAAKEQLPRRCAECGGELEPSIVLPELVCGDCQTTVPLPSGDEVLFRDLVELVEDQKSLAERDEP